LCLGRSIGFRCAKGSTTSHTETQSIYPNTSDGLRQLLQTMLMAAKNGEGARLSGLIKETEIPNYEVWFTETFGQEKGESWAGPYGQNLGQRQAEFQKLIIQIAQEDGEIRVTKLDATKQYDTLTVPLDLFLADWRKSAGPTSQSVDHIGYFMFIDGRFRWDSNVEFVPMQQTHTGFFVVGKLVKQVAPKYPREAREKLIQGTVTLNVILRKMGRLRYKASPMVTPFFPPQQSKPFANGASNQVCSMANRSICQPKLMWYLR